MKKEQAKSGPRFIFRPMYDKDDGKNYRVSVARDEKDEYGTSLCSVTYYDFSDDKTWRITETYPSDFIEFVRYTKFLNKEYAANFLHALINKHEQTVTGRPLGNDFVRYLEDRARNLHEEGQRLNNRMIQLHNEQCALNKLAKIYNVGKAEYMTELSDMDKAVEELAKFEVTIKLEEGTYDEDEEGIEKTEEGVYGTMPLIGAFYHLFDKDTARTIRSKIERICKHVAPVTSAKVF